MLSVVTLPVISMVTLAISVPTISLKLTRALLSLLEMAIDTNTYAVRPGVSAHGFVIIIRFYFYPEALGSCVRVRDFCTLENLEIFR